MKEANQFGALESGVSDWLHKHAKLSGVLATLILMFVVVFVSIINGHLDQQHDTRETTRAIRGIETKIDELVHISELAAITLAYSVDDNGVPQGFDSVSARIMNTTSFIDLLELVPNGVIEYVYPLAGNESVLGYNILQDPLVNKEAQLAKAKGEIYFAGPFELRQGGPAVAGRLPIYRGGEFWGFSAVLIRLENLLDYAGIVNEEGNNYFFQFSKIDPNTGKEQHFLPLLEGVQMSAEYDMTSFPEGQWKVRVMRPTTDGGIFITSIILMVGFVLSVVGGVVVYSHLLRGRQLSVAHAKLACQHQEITDSINSARYLQVSVLQSENDLKKVFPNSFVISSPKGVVSGDFFWVHQTEEHKIVAVIDCTGHGVSAALMSMLAGELLHQSIVVDKERSPAAVLSQMNKRLVELLQKNGHQNSMDGMDMLLCVFDNASAKLTFSGAKRPLYFARDGEIEERKGTRASIGGYEFKGQEKRFDQCDYHLQKGDMLYLTSDGYQSQFGGKRGKIMGKRAFRHLMRSIATLPVEEQLKHLTTHFDAWKRDEEQVDDVLVIGIRV